MVDPLVALLARASLALLLASSVAHKLRDLTAFHANVAEYRLLPAKAVGRVATGIVALELALLMALLVPAAARGALLGAAALLFVYGAAIAINLARGRRHIDCGCSGRSARQSISGGLIVRNALWIGVAGLGSLPAGGRILGWLDGTTGVACLIGLAALYRASEQLLAHAPVSAELRTRRSQA